MLKQRFKILYLIVIIIFVGCDPSYKIYLSNKSNEDVIVEISYMKNEEYIESVNYLKQELINYFIKQEDSLYIYKVPKDSYISFSGGNRSLPMNQGLPYSTLKFSYGNNILQFDSNHPIHKSKIIKSKSLNKIEIVLE